MADITVLPAPINQPSLLHVEAEDDRTQLCAGALQGGASLSEVCLASSWHLPALGWLVPPRTHTHTQGNGPGAYAPTGPGLGVHRLPHWRAQGLSQVSSVAALPALPPALDPQRPAGPRRRQGLGLSPET